MNTRNPLPYGPERVQRRVLSLRAKAELYEELADELRDTADGWSRQADALRTTATALIERLADDGIIEP